MDDTRDQLLDSYRQLVVLFQEQIAIAKKESYDEQFDEIKTLEEKKVKHFSDINHTRLNTDLYESLMEKHSGTIAQYIDELRELNDVLIQRINELYAEASRSMRQVTTQRKTLQSYGGVNYSDVISYYFDERK